MIYPFTDPNLEIPAPPQESRSEEWWVEYRFYHEMKVRWFELYRGYREASRQWWDEHRQFYEGRRENAGRLAAVKLATIEEYRVRYGPRVFVETGTYMGDTSWAVKDNFDVVCTIEIEPELCKKAAERFAGTNVCCHLGNSAEILPRVVVDPTRHTLFWIDAHWCDGGEAPDDRQSPARAELDFLFSLPPIHVILIDDARYFGGVAERDAEAEGYPDQSWIAERAASVGYSFEVAHDIIRLAPAR